MSFPHVNPVPQPPVFPPPLRRAVLPSARPEAKTSGASDVASLLDFFDTCARLKATKRTGWLRRGVVSPESVADHSFRAALMALALGRQVADVNVARAVQMALVHDLAEALVGDLVVDGEQAVRDKISREEKSQREQDAIEQICSLAGAQAGAEIQALWQDYENQRSPEARFCKDLDKLEMLSQARVYEEEQPSVDLSDFYRSTARYTFHSKVCRALDQEVRRRKRARLLEQQVANGSSDEVLVPGLMDRPEAADQDAHITIEGRAATSRATGTASSSASREVILNDKALPVEVWWQLRGGRLPPEPDGLGYHIQMLQPGEETVERTLEFVHQVCIKYDSPPQGECKTYHPVPGLSRIRVSDISGLCETSIYNDLPRTVDVWYKVLGGRLPQGDWWTGERTTLRPGETSAAVIQDSTYNVCVEEGTSLDSHCHAYVPKVGHVTLTVSDVLQAGQQPFDSDRRPSLTVLEPLDHHVMWLMGCGFAFALALQVVRTLRKSARTYELATTR